jgi:hypothetical protein
LNCRHIKTLLSAYLDSELTGCQMLVVRRHISHCRDCASELESLRELKELLASLPVHAPRESWRRNLDSCLDRESESWPEKIVSFCTKPIPAVTFTRWRRMGSACALTGLALFLLTGPSEQNSANFGDRRIFVSVGSPSPFAFGSSSESPVIRSRAKIYSFIDFLDPNRHQANLPQDSSSPFAYVKHHSAQNYSNSSLTPFSVNATFVDFSR